MGLFDRLRGGGGGGPERGSGSGSAAASASGPAGASAPADGTDARVSDTSAADGAGRGAGARVVRPAAWPALPPIQRATDRPGAVADAGFGGRLTTWQNPSFTGPLSHAVLDGAPGGLVKGLLAAPVGPASGLELPSLSLPVALPVESGEETGALPVQRMSSPVAALGPAGPRVTPAAPRATRPTSLTKAPTRPAVQRRALPAMKPSAPLPSVPQPSSTPAVTDPASGGGGSDGASGSGSGSGRTSVGSAASVSASRTSDAARRASAPASTLPGSGTPADFTGPVAPPVSVSRSRDGSAAGSDLPVQRSTPGGSGRTGLAAPSVRDEPSAGASVPAPPFRQHRAHRPLRAAARRRGRRVDARGWARPCPIRLRARRPYNVRCSVRRGPQRDDQARPVVRRLRPGRGLPGRCPPGQG